MKESQIEVDFCFLFLLKNTLVLDLKCPDPHEKKKEIKKRRNKIVSFNKPSRDQEAIPPFAFPVNGAKCELNNQRIDCDISVSR